MNWPFNAFSFETEQRINLSMHFLALKNDGNNTRNAFHLYGKTGENFPPNGTVQFSSAFHLYRKNSCSIGESNGTVLSTDNLGNKPRISPRSMVRKCAEANGSVIFWSFR